MLISAIVLAAGLSRRMGRPKMNLAWGDTTVIGQVVRTLSQAGIEDIVVVTGGANHEVEAALRGAHVRLVPNPDYAEGEMMRSLQVGLASSGETTEAALVVLGDQPQIREQTVRSILAAYLETGAELVIPSYQMRRGHPWIVARTLWHAIFELQPPRTLRDFLHDHANQIHYHPVDTASVLMDLDTPEDYQKYHPE